MNRGRREGTPKTISHRETLKRRDSLGKVLSFESIIAFSSIPRFTLWFLSPCNGSLVSEFYEFCALNTNALVLSRGEGPTTLTSFSASPRSVLDSLAVISRTTRN